MSAKSSKFDDISVYCPACGDPMPATAGVPPLLCEKCSALANAHGHDPQVGQRFVGAQRFDN